MQQDLSQVWNQSSLILHKAADQTEGLICETVANTEGQIFCILLTQQHSADNICFQKVTIDIKDANP